MRFLFLILFSIALQVHAQVPNEQAFNEYWSEVNQYRKDHSDLGEEGLLNCKSYKARWEYSYKIVPFSIAYRDDVTHAEINRLFTRNPKTKKLCKLIAYSDKLEAQHIDLSSLQNKWVYRFEYVSTKYVVIRGINKQGDDSLEKLIIYEVEL